MKCKYIIALLAIIIGIVLPIHSESLSYRLNKKLPSKITCSLTMDNGFYVIELSAYVENYYWPIILSIGTYQQQGRKITLHDSLYNYNTILEKDGKSNLKVLSGFCFMMNELFCFPIAINYRLHYDFNHLKHVTCWIDSVATEALQPQVSLELGEYRTLKYDYPAYTLCLLSDSTFIFKYGRLVLFDGVAQRKGNVLELHENNVGYIHRFLIDDAKLCAPVEHYWGPKDLFYDSH